MPMPIELLAAHHVRSGFDCGEPALNDFLQRQAGQMARKGFGKTYVALASDGTTVLGFVTLSLGQVETAHLPSTLKLPRYPALVLRIRRLAVDRAAQGQKIGRPLMAFALQISLEFSQQVGVYTVLVDAKHERAKAFYLALGFTATLDDPMCLFLPVATLRAVR